MHVYWYFTLFAFYTSVVIIYLHKHFDEYWSATVWYLFMTFLLSDIFVFLRLLSELQLDQETALILFRFSTIFTLLIPIFIIAFTESIGKGKINYKWYAVILVLLGYNIPETLKGEIAISGSHYSYVFTVKYSISLMYYYFILELYFLYVSIALISNISKRFKSRSRQANIIKRLFYLNLILLILSLYGIINIIMLGEMSSKMFYLVALPHTAIGLIFVFAVIWYDKFPFLIISDIKFFAIIDRYSGLEYYSYTFSSLGVNKSLISGMITAIINLSEEAFRSKIIKFIQMTDHIMVVESSEHLLAAVVARNYHNNIPVVIKRVLDRIEREINENLGLVKQLKSSIIDITQWKEIIEPIIMDEFEPLIP